MPPGQGSITWRLNYSVGGERIGMRVISDTSDEVYYLLTDHLGSTSKVLDAEGNVVSELRYNAWGETRYSDGITPTDRKYTGQPEAEAGLYYYGARWYDPAAGRFIQADTLITNIEKSQSFDRYAYVGNNPIRYVDPSGHRSDCTEQEIASGDETCEENFTNEDRENLLKDLYGWNILGDWTTEELIVLAEVAETIIKYVNQITNGNGTSWFLDYMGDININRVGGTNHYVLGNTVYITFTFLQTTTYHEDFAHELAHVWDNRTASMIGSFGATWYGGGAADELTKYVGGDPRGLRWWNGTSGIPPDYQWKKAI